MSVDSDDLSPPEGSVSSRRSSRVLKNDLLLHEAVIKNDGEAVRKVLREHVDINSRNNYGRAPIHWASSRGNTEIMEMLIGAKCDIEARDKYGMRPLLMAAWHGHADAVQLLINCGANVLAVNKKGYTLLMCAARNNRLSVIQFLMDTLEHIDVDIIDCEGQTALHHAAIAGHREIVARLVQIGANTRTANKQGRTPLHLACEKGHTDVVQFLLRHDSEVEAKDEDGNTPLHVTVENKQTVVTTLLLESGVNSDAENNKGYTALHIASSSSCRGIIDALIQYGCNLDKQSNRLQSPIHIAAEHGFTEICKILLAAGANIEQREQGGRTPLYIAARGSFTAIVDMIIKTARLDYPEPEDCNLAGRRKWRLKQESGNTSWDGQERFKQILWKLAYKQLEPSDWKRLAHHWAFTEEQIRAIEHQYTGPNSYKEHAHRMMNIWFEGLAPDVNPTKILCESLAAINKKSLAESVKKKLTQDVEISSHHKTGRKCCKNCAIL